MMIQQTRRDKISVNQSMAGKASSAPVFIDGATLRTALPYESLINHLQASLPFATSSVQSPLRHSHATSSSSTLLLMPSWPTSSSSTLPYVGVKLVTTHPENSLVDLPGVHATYVLFSSVTGQNLASMDGTELTLRRTACVSALASSFLSSEASKVLLLVGAGALGPHLIRAHFTTRPSVRTVMIWNRNLGKAKSLVDKMGEEEGMEGVSFEACLDLETAVRGADIVSCATNSEAPLVLGEWLKHGAHLDLVGSYKPSMRECDDDAIRRGRVFVDNEVAKVEAGELVGAFERGVISQDGGVEGDLVELIQGVKSGRKHGNDITVFVSVGSAVVDLLTAQLAYETITVKP